MVPTCWRLPTYTTALVSARPWTACQFPPLPARSSGWWDATRVQLVVALVHAPELLVLDEPFAGLDPEAIDSLTEVLRELAAGGAAILFSSHQLEISILLLAGYLLVYAVIASPDATWLRVLAFVLVMTPTLAPARIAGARRCAGGPALPHAARARCPSSPAAAMARTGQR
jgi:putative AbiEii toxin of type IV toxin-antitoxin system